VIAHLSFCKIWTNGAKVSIEFKMIFIIENNLKFDFFNQSMYVHHIDFLIFPFTSQTLTLEPMTLEFDLFSQFFAW
jgi:hypothetical protein